MKRRLTQALGGALIFATFGCVSAEYGVYSLWRAERAWWLAGPLALTMILIMGLTKLQRRIEALPADPQSADVERRDARNRQIFTAVNLVMIAAIFAAVKFWLGTQHPEYLAPTAAAIVGLNLVALARPMETRVHAIAGVLICLLAAGVMMAMPAPRWAGFIGLGGAVILWVSFAVQLREVLTAV